MSNTTDQWILDQCKKLGINARNGNNAWRLEQIRKHARIQRQLLADKSHTTATSMACVLNQSVRILNANGLVANGILKRNRVNWRYEIFSGSTRVADFTHDQIDHMEFRGVWLIWIR